MNKKNIGALALVVAFLAAIPSFSRAATAPAETMTAENSLLLKYGDKTFPVSADTINTWRGRSSVQTASPAVWTVPGAREMLLSYVGQNVKKAPVSTTVNFRPAAIYNHLQTLASEIDVKVQEPKLVIEGSVVKEFQEPRDGKEMDIRATAMGLIESLQNNRLEADVIVNSTRPETNLAAINNLGIQELLARGESNFKGSPKNRRHNITIGVEKMTGILLSPGETFSFNDHLGPVEADQGFVPELVIKREGTVPELGGGLCQVSSTVFRAAMQAGLPITERRNHAYPVQYYAPQGTDATIYPGVVDLKFTNDTPGTILIWPSFPNADTVVFDFWGTRDDRQVVLSTPRQYDKRSDGSMKAEWQRQVTKGGATVTNLFKSNYQSPALYHKTESFVPAATTSPDGLVQLPVN